MVRVTYSSATIGGTMVAEGVDHIRKGRELLERATSLMNSISAGGATPALLESSVEFGVAVGQGSAFYSAVNEMKVNAAAVTDAAIADIDMGG